MDLRKHFGWEAGDPLVATIGHLAPVKRHGDFIRMAAIVEKRVPRAKFIILGNLYQNRSPKLQRYFKGLRRLARAVGLTGTLHFVQGLEDLDGVFSQIDVIAHPCAVEGLPNAVLEAMAWAKPVVAARGGGSLELIDSGRTGLLVPPARPAAMAKAVIRLLGDPSEARRLGVGASKRAKTDHDMKRVARRYVMLLEGCLNHCSV